MSLLFYILEIQLEDGLSDSVMIAFVMLIISLIVFILVLRFREIRRDQGLMPLDY
jgi:hypothetical protein